MNDKSLIHSSVLAAIFVAAVIGVSMLTGFPGTNPFISVDPIGDKNVGDIFTVTGTTNLPAGTNLFVRIEPASFGPEGGVNGEFSGAAGGVDVVAGTGGINTWSMEVNTSTLNPVKMRVNASVFTGDVLKGDLSTGEPTGTREFTLHTAPGNAAGSTLQGSETAGYIRIDPVPDKTTGDLLIVTGSTSLPVGTALMVQTDNWGGNTEVTRGSNEVNRFSIPADTSIMKPGTKTIKVNNMIGNLEKGDYRPGTVNATSSFTLKGPFLATDSPAQGVITGGDYIRINAIGDKSVGDQFLITGTTSLPVGTEVLMQVMPDTGTTPTGTNKTALGAGGNGLVTKGDGSLNRVSFAVDMSGQKPGKWVALVGKMKKEPFEVEDPTASAFFTLK
jgi:hypothetical protein